MSPENSNLFPEQNSNSSTKANTSGNTGDTGDIFRKLEEEGEDKIKDSSGVYTNSNTDHLIAYKEPFYYCKEHHTSKTYIEKR